MCIFHKWNKWSDLFQSDEGQSQIRSCKKCGKIVNRKVKNHLGISITELNKKIKETENE